MIPIIDAKSLTFSYREGHNILDKVDFSIYPGQLISLLGPNGVGSVDMSLQTNMFRVALDNPPDTMVLLTGDGSGGALGKGFLADIKRIHKLGWNIEVYAWESTCNRYLKSFAEENGIFVPLEKYYYSITFLKGERVVQPLVR